jgi:hypothetical protein
MQGIQQQTIETIKVVISDGFHTEHTKPIEKEKQILHKKFDYAIGIGNHEADFDKKFLEHIGKEFTFHCASEPLDFRFLLPAVDGFEQKYIYVPPQTELFTTNEITLEPLGSSEINDPENEMLGEGLFYMKKKFKPMEQPLVTAKRHYLFFIDISGSMDHRISQSSILTNYYKNCNFNIQTTMNDWMKIPLYFSKELTFLKKNTIPLHKADGEDTLDTMIRIVSNMRHLKKLKSRIKLDFLIEYEKESVSIDDAFFQKFFQKNYHALLSNAEKNYIKLSQSLPVVSLHFQQPTNDTTAFSKQCVICYEKDKSELFSCLHFVCCYQCCLETIQHKYPPECPICRKPISWIGPCRRRTEKCIRCKLHPPSIYSYPSGEITHCKNCVSNTGCTIEIPFFFT